MMIRPERRKLLIALYFFLLDIVNFLYNSIQHRGATPPRPEPYHSVLSVNGDNGHLLSAAVLDRCELQNGRATARVHQCGPGRDRSRRARHWAEECNDYLIKCLTHRLPRFVFIYFLISSSTYSVSSQAIPPLLFVTLPKQTTNQKNTCTLHCVILYSFNSISVQK